MFSRLRTIAACCVRVRVKLGSTDSEESADTHSLPAICPTLKVDDTMYACIREFEAKRPLFFIATVLVLVYANSSWAAKYADVWQTKLTVGLGGVEEAVTLRA